MKTFFRVFLRGEPATWFDVPADHIDFMQYITGCRIQGFILHQTFYVPMNEVRHIGVVQTTEAGAAPFRPQVVN